MYSSRFSPPFVLVLAALWGFAAVNADEQPPFAGIGVTIVESVVGVRIATVLPGGAADLSNQLRPHDAIIAVAEGDGKATSLRGLSVVDAVELIRGKPGSEVRLTIIPADNQVVKRKEIALKRAVLATASAATAVAVGKRAPDFNFLRLDDAERGKLSDFAGKVVVLEFWATWCGPCQMPMAKMQTHVGTYPQWRDKVTWLTISVDRNREQVTNHLKQRGWTKTLNGWDDKGVAQLYNINAIPEVLVIGPDGTIAAIGHPGVLNVPEIVAKALGEPLPEDGKEDATEPAKADQVTVPE